MSKETNLQWNQEKRKQEGRLDGKMKKWRMFGWKKTRSLGKRKKERKQRLDERKKTGKLDEKKEIKVVT